ncbi:hypothetical protein RRG08_044397 [Elysia crispata]|uniref:Uncharacterized protein n=1 Tax=Elysia crispata TaxID=231223 RepID=A0AAE0ZVC4_9GAST|nr:hypothetical protein RRG08_044397 [Elysia crispata]
MKAWSVVALAAVAITVCSAQSPAANTVDPFISLLSTRPTASSPLRFWQRTANLELLFNKIGYITILEYLGCSPSRLPAPIHPVQHRALENGPILDFTNSSRSCFLPRA